MVLPEDLKAVEQIPMNEFVTRLRRLKRVEVKDTSWPFWVYVLINLEITCSSSNLIFVL